MTNQEKINAHLHQDNFEKQPIHYEGNPYCLEVYKTVKKEDSVSELHYPIAYGVPIVEGDITYDNDVTTNTKIKISFIMGDSIRRVEVSRDKFENECFKDIPEYRIIPGGNNRAYVVDCTRQQMSGSLMTHETVYGHTGNRTVNGERLFFLQGCALYKDGFVDGITVDLNDERLVKNYAPSHDKDPERYETVSDFINIAPPFVMYPFLSLVFLSAANDILRSVGYEPAFVLYPLAKTQSFKSSICGTVLSFYGKANVRELSESSRTSEAALYLSGQKLKDVVYVIDDICPQNTRFKKEKQEGLVQNAVRLWGNRDVTNRAKRSGDGLRPVAPVKGNLIITGEYIPEIGQSGVGRLMVTEWTADDVDTKMLTKVQKNGHHLSQVYTDYIPWMLGHYDDFLESFEDIFISLRSKANMPQGRTNEAVAHLQMGMMLFVRFMTETNHMTHEDGEKMLEKSWDVFRQLGAKQTETVESASPVSLFVNAFGEMLVTKRITFADLNKPSAYCENKDGEISLTPSVSQRTNIGYKDDNFYYIRQEGLKTALIKFYQEQGTLPPFDITPLLKQLAKEGLIVTDGKLLTKKKVIEGQGKRYIWLSSKAVDEYEEDGEDDEE